MRNALNSRLLADPTIGIDRILSYHLVSAVSLSPQAKIGGRRIKGGDATVGRPVRGLDPSRVSQARQRLAVIPERRSLIRDLGALKRSHFFQIPARASLGRDDEPLA